MDVSPSHRLAPLESSYNDGWLHLTTNANGELVVDRYENLFVRCEKP